MRYTMQASNYGAFAVNNLTILQMMMNRDNSELMLFPGLSEGAWQPSTMAGINADTKAEAFAAEFIQAMLSLEVQQINYGEGLPVTQAAIAGQIADVNERLSEFGTGTFDLDLNSLINRLRVPSAPDMTLNDIMWTTVERLCTGRIDIEGAVTEIGQNLRTYLAERAQ
jgi:ABC-type glycerol-3-phosphate transport system substrate-binding protein